jgi:RNA recognition motif-containing protein
MAPRNVWVANLPPECDEALLRDLFAEFGPIQATKVFTDCPKGVCGLVLFKDPGDALRAVTFMHEFPLQGQRLVVQLAINNRLSQYENGPQGTNIWVGNLPPDYTEDALRSLMSAYGSVSSLRLLEREPTAAPRALAAMVNFSTVEEAARALEALNGQPLGPRAKPLVLKYASPPPLTPSNEATGSLAALQLASGNANSNVWVGNLPPNFNEADIRMLFETYGPITSTKVLRNRVTGHTEGAALVDFARPHHALLAIQALHGYPLDVGGKPLIARLAARPRVPPFQSITPPPHLLLPLRYDTAAIPANLWVGNLPPQYTEADVHALFAPCGAVIHVKLLKDHANRPGERAAMVNYATPFEAAAAIQTLSGLQLPGTDKPLIVKYAANAALRSPPPAVPPSGASDNLWVGNVPPGYTEAAVHALFSIYGVVQSCVVLKEASRQNGLRAAMVRFASVAEATAALQGINGVRVEANGEPLVVRFADGRKAKSKDRDPPPPPSLQPVAGSPPPQ